jgi:hypothetical protein
MQKPEIGASLGVLDTWDFGYREMEMTKTLIIRSTKVTKPEVQK